VLACQAGSREFKSHRPLQFERRLMSLKCWFRRIVICPYKNTIDFFRYDIPYGIKNLIRWFPVIWQDRNWDQYYIYVILHKKLTLMEKGLRNGCHLYADKTADQVKICVLLLDRLIKDEYHENAFKRHEEKWGEAEFNFEDLEEKPDQCRLLITRLNVKTKKDEEQERKDFMRTSKHSDQMKNQDVEMLFKIMNKHIQGWWD
jgi:hypothetical protein